MTVTNTGKCGRSGERTEELQRIPPEWDFRHSKYNKVLLIEAGGTPFYANHIPAMAGALIHTPEVDYMYKTVPQKTGALGFIDQVKAQFTVWFIKNEKFAKITGNM